MRRAEISNIVPFFKAKQIPDDIPLFQHHSSISVLQFTAPIVTNDVLFAFAKRNLLWEVKKSNQNLEDSTDPSILMRETHPLCLDLLSFDFNRFNLGYHIFCVLGGLITMIINFKKKDLCSDLAHMSVNFECKF